MVKYRAGLVMLAFCVWLVGGAAGGEPRAAGDGNTGAELNVMSFNIRYGAGNDGEDAWEKRRGLVMDVVKDAGADVIGLQEALKFQIDEIRAAVGGYAVVGVGRDDGKEKGEYSAILYKSGEFEAKESGTFWFSDTPEVVGSKSWGNGITRICTWVRLSAASPGKADAKSDGGAARAFYVFNVHLDHQSEPSRQKSAELLARRILGRAHPDEPVIVTGDFNCGEQSAAAQFLTGRAKSAVAGGSGVEGWKGLVDCYRAVKPEGAEEGTFHAFKGVGGVGKDKIDFVFVSEGMKVLSAEIVRTERQGRYPSDHFPVVAKVSF